MDAPTGATLLRMSVRLDSTATPPMVIASAPPDFVAVFSNISVSMACSSPPSWTRAAGPISAALPETIVVASETSPDPATCTAPPGLSTRYDLKTYATPPKTCRARVVPPAPLALVSLQAVITSTKPSGCSPSTMTVGLTIVRPLR